MSTGNQVKQAASGGKAGKKRLAKIVSGGFIGLLILSFMLWDVGTVGVTTGDDVIIEVGDVSVTRREFDLEWASMLQRATLQLQRRPSNEEIIQLGMREQLLADLARRAALEAAARALGLAAPEEYIAEQLASEPAFAGADGKFSSDAFAYAVRNSGYNEVAYLNRVRSDVRRFQLITAVSSGIAPLPVDLMLRALRQTRDLSLITLPDIEPENTTPNQQQVEQTWNSFARLWTRPEYRRVAALSLSIPELATQQEVSEDEARQWYDDDPEAFVSPQRRRVRQIVVGDMERARALAAELRSGALAWSDALRRFNLQAADADLGLTTAQGILNAQVREAAFAYPSTGEAFAIETDFGAVVAEVTEIEAGDGGDFQSVKARVISELKRDRATGELLDYQEIIDSAIAAGQSLEELAEVTGRAIVYTPFFAASGAVATEEHLASMGDAAATPPSDAAALDFLGAEGIRDVFAAAQSDAVGAPISSQDDTRLTWISVSHIVPSAALPLEEVRPAVIAKWRAEARQQARLEAARSALERANQALDFRALAAELGAPMLDLSDVAVASSGEQFSSGALETIFETRLGDTVIVPNSTNTNYLLVRVSDIKDPEDALEDDVISVFSRSVNQSMATELVDEFVRDLLQEYPPRFNQAVLEEIAAQTVGG